MMLMHEKRLTSRLITYWQRLKKEEALPRYAWLNPASIDDMWSRCITLVSTPSKQHRIYRYEYVGTKIRDAWGKDFTGELVNRGGNHLFSNAAIINQLHDVSQTLDTVIDQGKYINTQNKVVKYRYCLLPFGSEKEGVTHVLVGLSWKDF